MRGAQVSLRGLRVPEGAEGKNGEKKPIKAGKTHLNPALRRLWGLLAVGMSGSCSCVELRVSFFFFTDSGGFRRRTERGRRFPARSVT